MWVHLGTYIHTKHIIQILYILHGVIYISWFILFLLFIHRYSNCTLFFILSKAIISKVWCFWQSSLYPYLFSTPSRDSQWWTDLIHVSNIHWVWNKLLLGTKTNIHDRSYFCILPCTKSFVIILENKFENRALWKLLRNEFQVLWGFIP